MKTIDLFIFDLDGTLVDSSLDIAAAVNHTLRRLGERELSPDQVQNNVGDGVLQLLKRCLLENHQDRIEEAVTLFRSRYGAHLTDHTTLYPGVREVLDHFSSKNKAILTNKPERFVAPILKGLKIHPWIDYAVGGDGRGVPKPSVASVQKILEYFGVGSARAVMVGDSPIDIETGKLGGILTCAVTYGYRSREELKAAEPDYIIDRIEELKDLFC